MIMKFILLVTLWASPTPYQTYQDGEWLPAFERSSLCPEVNVCLPKYWKQCYYGQNVPFSYAYEHGRRRSDTYPCDKLGPDFWMNIKPEWVYPNGYY